MTEQDFKRACIARIDLYRHLRNRKQREREQSSARLEEIEGRYASLADFRQATLIARQRVARIRALVLQ